MAFIARSRPLGLPGDFPKNEKKPRSAMDFAELALAGNPNPTTAETLAALSRGAELSRGDPCLWERRSVPNPGGGFTVPFVKIGRRR